jgi:hypothetical protein
MDNFLVLISPSRLAQATELVTCTFEVLSSNLGQNTTQVFRGLPLPPDKCPGNQYLKLGYRHSFHIISNSLITIIQSFDAT